MREILRIPAKFRFMQWALTAMTVCLLCNCQSPLDKPDSTSDLIEFESVWQYLKAYSIHQDQVPTDPFSFSSPADLMVAVHDTLKGNPYTHYYYDESSVGALASLSASADSYTGYPPTVFLDSISDSMACITDTGFEFWTWADFKRCANNATRYPNIIIDLRHNRGGQLDVLDSIICAMVPLGTRYIEAQDREFDKKKKSYITRDWHSLVTQDTLLPWFGGRKKKYVVIMDSMTASASEILASALYEGDTATKLIGTRSYGKGMGQIILDRRTRLPIQITFLYIRGVNKSTADGVYESRIGNYHRVGIVPDIVPQAYQDEGATIKDSWNRQIFYAAKMLDSNVTPETIAYPEKQFGAKVSATMSSGLYKVIKEEDLEK
jgi:hypothetical protein